MYIFSLFPFQNIQAEETTDLSKYMDDVLDTLSYLRSVRWEEQSICTSGKGMNFTQLVQLYYEFLSSLVFVNMSLFTHSLL